MGLRPLVPLLAGAFSLSAQSLQSPLPQASPWATVAGDSISFSVANPAGGGALYHWNFGDGTTRDSSTTPDARHAYAQPGRYPVRVSVELGGEFRGAVLPVLIHRPLPARRPVSSSFLAMDAMRRKLFVSNSDQNSVSAIDLDSLNRLWEMPVAKGPATLALAPDGTLWVVCRDEDVILILNPASGAEISRLALPYGSRSFGIAFDPSGNGKAFLTLQGSGRVARLDASGKVLETSVEIGPEARHLSIAPDGSRAFVGRFISPQTHGEVSELGLPALTLTRRLSLPEDTGPDAENTGRGVPNYLEGLALSPDATRLWIPAKKDNVNGYTFGDPGFKAFQNTVRAMARVFDVSSGPAVETARFDFDDSEGPSAITFAPLGDPVFVAFRGSNKVQAFDPWRNGLLFSVPTGLGPNALLVDSARGRLYVHAALSREVRVYDISGALDHTDNVATPLTAITTVAQEALPAAVVRGKRIFHNSTDARMSKDGYISCGACHFEGDGDGRVMDFTARGEGLRRTLPLWVRAGTRHGPVHWSANFDEIQDFEHDIRGPFGGLGFMDSAVFNSAGRNTSLDGAKTGFSPELDDLAAYVASLTVGPRSPYRNTDGTLSADAVAGREIFSRASVGCAQCHVPPLYTDSRLPTPGSPVPPDPSADSILNHRSYYTAQGFLIHDVGTLKPASGSRLGDTLRGLDTPTLIGLFAGGPYLHDGSAATLLDVLNSANPGDRHGMTSALSAPEKRQLTAFLLSLDTEGGQSSIRPAKRTAVHPTGGRLILDRRRGSPGIRWEPGSPNPLWTDLRGKAIPPLQIE